ncbi:MAG: hypothetical protein COW88_00175 [Candidatus Lloydbacteria bacterium CG22_combo_CG10-13_8_21_14_all_47_15]|uniref:Pilus assembly protein PilO n=1 Tax=Candidatus Lloydbacteria bacterium CG22_combo_CG10-13_8_21_14_all_47_15 TaxID=1974635 RepID=A0A2H0CX31_9BACT|nr:MAG: hypothetical protein COW88_00175 [Candidatus Lloydbacteria bacterium CG22_combo_CG10-13_8_21_14_all_47_15]
MRFLLPILLLAISIGIYIGLIEPLNRDVAHIKAGVAEFDTALAKAKELQAVRDGLIGRYNEFPLSDLERVEKLLPDNVDNVRLIMDIDNIANRYKMALKNTRIIARGQEQPGGGMPAGVGTVGLSFSVSAPYETFLAFLNDLEQSLRIVDIGSITFTAGDVDFYEYSVLLNTYWLK